MVVSFAPKKRTRGSDEQSSVYFFFNTSTRLFDVLAINMVNYSKLNPADKYSPVYIRACKKAPL